MQETRPPESFFYFCVPLLCSSSQWSEFWDGDVRKIYEPKIMTDKKI
jgi:hypothetical protein